MTGHRYITNYMGSIRSVQFSICDVARFASCSIFHDNNTYRHIWSDEFDYNGYPDTVKWSYELGDGCQAVCKWGNDPFHYYENGLKNAKVEKCQLTINAIKEEIYKYHFTSASLVTKNKHNWTYGKIDVRAKLPKGRGTWPAIWLLASDHNYGGWPESKEIDIMEKVCFTKDSISSSIHTRSYHHSIGTQKTKGMFLPAAEEVSHICGLTWSEKEIIITIGGKEYHSFSNEKTEHKEWPFDRIFYLIVNLAIGEFWGGAHGIDDTIIHQSMAVDYEREYQKIN
ncbi:MAG: glycoside hydrolase family 16 protein [Saprospiraceae bacterium]|nr:glycoside hydrolase family 16 protein [Saprospiraceae bacterium]